MAHPRREKQGVQHGAARRGGDQDNRERRAVCAFNMTRSARTIFELALGSMVVTASRSHWCAPWSPAWSRLSAARAIRGEGCDRDACAGEGNPTNRAISASSALWERLPRLIDDECHPIVT